MIYVDEINEWQSGKWCHMWSDTSDEELDTFAKVIGLRKSWAQNRPGFYHYDLRPSKRKLALSKGAEFMRLRDWIMKKREN